MNDRLVVIDLPVVFPGASSALGANYAYFYAPCDLTVVYVTAAPSVDDTGLTLAINDDGSAIFTAMACADKDVPGTWKTTHMGGSNDPVTIAAGSKVSFTAANAANATMIVGQIWCLTGEEWS